MQSNLQNNYAIWISIFIPHSLKIFFAGCADPSRIGNGICDDETNNEVCEWDGGDCCGDNVNNLFCNVCRCNYSFIPDL